MNKNNKETLFIRFHTNFELVGGQLQQEILYKRKQELHNLLLKVTQKHHQEFLDSKNLQCSLNQ